MTSETLCNIPTTYYSAGIHLVKLVAFKRIRPMQWLTPMIGFFQSCAKVRATRATDIKGGAIPGPVAKYTTTRTDSLCTE